MTREQAGGRFGVTWGAGVLTSLLGQALDVRDGTLRRGAPDYGWAFLSLLLIAGLWGLLSFAVLVLVDDDVTLTDVSTGSALGTFATLVAWWVLRGRRRPAA